LGCSSGSSGQPNNGAGGSTTAKGGTGGLTSTNGGSNSGGSTSGGAQNGQGGATNQGGSTNGGAQPQGGSTSGGTSAGGNTAAGSGGAVSAGGSTAGSGGAVSAGGSTAGGNSMGGGTVVNPDPSRACAPKSIDVISDFEENSGVMVKQGTPQRTGRWGVYSETAGAVTPPKSDTPIPVAASGETDMCNKYSLHVTGKSIGTYGGFSTAFLPMAAPSQLRTAYDLSAYAGISFRIKSGSGTPPAIFFEMQTKQNQPTTSGGSLSDANPGPDSAIGLYNGRGQIIVPPDVSTTWQTVYVPFGQLIPRWVPAAGSSNACPAPATGVPKCQAAKFVPTDVLGIQFSFYQDKGFPKPSGSTAGNFDIWLDDVTLYKASPDLKDTPAPPKSGGSKPFPLNGTVGSCTKPSGLAVDGKFLVSAYNQWKSKFVVAADGGFRVQRPENNNDSVSEGIAYGMMIAVAMDDKALFDGLYTYWGKHLAVGSLMTWQVPGGSGTATDADEDAAFAMLLASKQWSGGSYASEAAKLIDDVRKNDMEGNTITGGSNYGASDPTNPSYFAPAWYRAFAAVDTANASTWNGLASKSYQMIGALTSKFPNGLLSAWCNSSCSDAATNSGSQNPATDVLYQYDSHRIPWRVGLDYCWNGTAEAKSYVDKVSTFFSGTAGKDGVGRIFDTYTPSSGREASGAAVNSASILGTAAVGAMASGGSNKAFADDAYQAVFDLVTRGNLGDPGDGTKTAYSYYNATVGLLTLLTMTGNIPKP